MFGIIKKIPAIVIVATLTFILWQKISDDRAYKSWPTAQARLLSAEVVVGSSGLIRQPGSRYYSVGVTYDFSVNGKVYRSGAHNIGAPRFATDKEALQYLAQLKASPVLMVHYHPRTPEKNTLAHLNQ